MLRVYVFPGSNPPPCSGNSHSILDLRVQMGSGVSHPLHMEGGNKSGAGDDVEPPSVPDEHRTHLSSWTRDACLQVRSRYICIHALSFDMLGLDLAAGESTQSSSTRCSTCLLSPALLWASSLPGTTRVSGQIRFHISTVFTPGSGLELWGYSRFR